VPTSLSGTVEAPSTLSTGGVNSRRGKTDDAMMLQRRSRRQQKLHVLDQGECIPITQCSAPSERQLIDDNAMLPLSREPWTCIVADSCCYYRFGHIAHQRQSQRSSLLYQHPRVKVPTTLMRGSAVPASHPPLLGVRMGHGGTSLLRRHPSQDDVCRLQEEKM
jgi:hypothetical protein